MMKWNKKGLIYAPARTTWWDLQYAMLPTPEYNGEGYLRIWFGTADKDRNGRISWVDVDPDDPSKIIRVADNFVLDIGVPGSFDDSGVIPSSIIKIGEELFLYYIGFQRCEKVPYKLFPGLARCRYRISGRYPISQSSPNFERVTPVPLLERDENDPISIGAPFVMKDEEIYKMWYWSGSKWETVNNKLYIAANICYAESNDGILWQKMGVCFSPTEEMEFSFGRPWVIKENGSYKMWYSIRYTDRMYRLGYAISDDGKNWIRKDEEVGIDVSENGWDCEMICYASVIKVKQRTYMFYNGNNNGEGGFGYAELIN